MTHSNEKNTLNRVIPIFFFFENLNSTTQLQQLCQVISTVKSRQLNHPYWLQESQCSPETAGDTEGEWKTDREWAKTRRLEEHDQQRLVVAEAEMGSLVERGGVARKETWERPTGMEQSMGFILLILFHQALGELDTWQRVVRKEGKGREKGKQKYVYQLASSGWFWDQGCPLHYLTTLLHSSGRFVYVCWQEKQIEELKNVLWSCKSFKNAPEWNDVKCL